MIPEPDPIALMFPRNVPVTLLRSQLTGRAALLYDILAQEYPGYQWRSVRMAKADRLDYPFRTLVRSAHLGKVSLGLCWKEWPDDRLLSVIEDQPEVILDAAALLEGQQAGCQRRHWWSDYYYDKHIDWVLAVLMILPIAGPVFYLMVNALIKMAELSGGLPH